MKSTLNLINVLYQVLAGSSLKGAITGKIYKMRRPVNSDKEDVVINSLALTSDQLQRAVLNVNIFVKDIEFDEIDPDTGERVTSQYPDLERLEYLASLVLPILEEGISGDYVWSVQQQATFQDEEAANQHYLNIRVDFFVSNI
jgi:hypothetical protein